MPTEQKTDRYVKRRANRITRQCRSIIDEIKPFAYEQAVDWCEANIDLGVDQTSEATGLIKIRDYTPQLIEPLEFCTRLGKLKLTVQAVEQTGKSQSWKLIVAWRQRFMPASTGIIYQNKDVGTVVIRDSYVPVLRAVPAFKRSLAKPQNRSMTRLKMPESVIYLMSGDAPIIAFPMGVIVGDEINKWRLEKAHRRKSKFKSDEDYQVSKIKDMDKRTRTFKNSLRILVCSPEGKKAPITLEYDKSSKGVEFLRCGKCKKLVFDTTKPEDYFQYKAKNGIIDPKSIKLKCPNPKCGFEHKETDWKVKLTRSGEYIHEFPARLTGARPHMGVCYGALSSQMPGIDWLEICDATEIAKNTHSYEAQAYFCNSIKGVAFSPDVLTGDALNVIATHHVPEISEDIIEKFAAIYMGVDTQDVGYWYSIEAVDVDNNWYTLDYAFAWDDDVVIKAWNQKYYGIQPMAGIIDEGGSRKPDVDNLLCKLGSGFYKYKGEGGNHKENFRISENDNKLLLCKARYYQMLLLYMIYSQHQRDNNYWYIVAPLKKTYLRQLAAFQPPPNSPDADFEEWSPGERQHDLFDARKMPIALHEFAKKEFPTSFWRTGQATMSNNSPQIVVKKKSPIGGSQY